MRREARVSTALLFMATTLLALSGLALATPEAEQVAMDAAERWARGEYRASPQAARTIEEVLEAARVEAAFDPPPAEVTVLHDSIRAVGEPADGRWRFDLAYVSPERDGTVSVILELRPEGWREVSVLDRDRPRTWLQALQDPPFIAQPAAGLVFLALTIAAAVSLASPRSVVRRAIVSGIATIRAHPGAYLAASISIYGLFLLGTFLGAADPGLRQQIAATVGSALDRLHGLSAAVRSGDVLHAAAVIFWNNLFSGIGLTAALAIPLGILAFVVNGARFLIFGIALAPGSAPTALLLLHVPTIIIELQAYILPTAGGAAILTGALRGGWGGFREGLRALGALTALGVLVLVVGAWYEAFSLFAIAPLVVTP
jgi:hypothetical protein